MIRLLLVRHAVTGETRRAAFPSTTGAAPADPCEPLDRRGLECSRALRAHLPDSHAIWSSFAVRARQTAEALTSGAVVCDGDLAEADFGRWAGRTAVEVHTDEPAALSTWYADPSTAPHGGEDLAAVRARAARILARAAAAGGTVVAVTHGGLVKAALLEVLQLPDSAIWRLDVAPCSVTQLHRDGGAWRVVRTNWTPALQAVAA